MFLDQYQGPERDAIIEKYEEMESMIGDWLCDLESEYNDEDCLQVMAASIDEDTL